jgi:hypothetical protein
MKGNNIMVRKLAFLVTTVAVTAAAGSIATSASAATVDQLVTACDKMNSAKSGSCSYKIYQKTVQGLSGCTSNNVCFDCPADGKRLCFAVPGKGGKVGETQLPSP